MHRKGWRLLSSAFALILTLSLFVFPQPAKADASMQTMGQPGMVDYMTRSTDLLVLDGKLYLAAGLVPKYYSDTSQNYLCIYRWDGESTGWSQIGSFNHHDLSDYNVEFTCNGDSLFAAYYVGNSIYVNRCDNPQDATPIWSQVGSSSVNTISIGEMQMAVDGNMLYLAVGGNDFFAYLYSFDTTSGTGWTMVGGGAIGSTNGASIALTIHNGKPYVSYNDSDWLNGTVVKTYTNGAWSTYWNSLEVSYPETFILDDAGNIYLCGAKYNYDTAIYEEKFFVKDSSGLHTYSGISGTQAGSSRMLFFSPSDIYIACNVYNTVFFGRFDGQSITSLYSYSASSLDAPDVVWYDNALVMSYRNDTKQPAVSRYLTDYALTAAQVSVTNNAGSADTVAVTGITAGDRVAVYADSNCTDLLGTAFVAGDATSATVSIEQIGYGAGTVYVTLSNGANWTPTPVAADYDAEPVTVSFDSQGGSAVSSIVMGYGSLVTKPANPTRTGYNFSGWYKEKACTNAWDFDTDQLKGDTILYAKWIPIYAVAVSANDSASGTVSGGGSYAAGATATVKATPKAGYRFARWLEGSTAVSTSASYSFPVTKARTLKGEFAAIGKSSTTAASASYNSVKVSWTKVTGATGYQVYRAASKTGTYTMVGETTGTSYTNKSLTTGKTYYYKVRVKCAASTATTYGPFSNTVAARPVPAAPTGVKAASAGYTSAKISWSKVSGATKYQVYRATSKTGTYTKVAETTSTSYTNKSLTTGKTYYYKVRAYSMVGTEKVTGSYSAVVSAKPVPAAPTGVKAARVSNSSLKVSWSKVSGTTKYQVYRATSKTGTYTKVGETTSLSYTNKGLKNNKTYYYKVRAYHTEKSVKVYGSYSAIVYAKP